MSKPCFSKGTLRFITIIQVEDLSEDSEYWRTSSYRSDQRLVLHPCTRAWESCGCSGGVHHRLQTGHVGEDLWSIRTHEASCSLGLGHWANSASMSSPHGQPYLMRTTR